MYLTNIDSIVHGLLRATETVGETMLSWKNAFTETILSKSVDWFMRKPLEDDKDKVKFEAK